MARDELSESRWKEVDRIFEMALDEPPEVRRGVVRRACGDDEQLRVAVLELLEIAESEDARLVSPGPDLVRAALPPSGDRPGLAPGDLIGHYRIVGELGSGGMATVYEAERSDGAYEQVVALKVLRPGLDTERIVQRFLAERQILSDFAHPNVARLLDGGATADGRPFLVMERVRGQPITRWAEARGASLRTRLELFLQVTDAVKEAHRRLVVHRDLKPANILVDDSGQVKLLDFGIAKLLRPDVDLRLTEVGTYPLTRRYASPEQLRSDPVTTSTDIYQLGLILHELLTGSWPLDRQTGRVETSLTGDLDTIVRKALEPDPDDRFDSVDAMAADVRAHLDGRPIAARPAPWWLRTRKWFGRNRWAPPVAAALLVGAALFVGTLVLSADRLEQERNEARAQAERAERIKGMLVDLFRSTNPFAGEESAGRPDVTVAEALAPAVDRIRSDLADDPLAQADLLAAVASVLQSIDRGPEGRPLIEEALEIRRDQGQERSPAFASDLLTMSALLRAEDWDSAAVLLHRAIETLEASVPPDDPRLAEALGELMWLQLTRIPPAEPTLGERALAIYRAAGHRYREEVAGVLGHLSYAYAQRGDLDASEEAAREALRLTRETRGDQDVSTALASVQLAAALDERRRFDEAIPLYRDAIPILERTAGPEHNQTLSAKGNLATTYQAAGRTTEAVSVHRDLLATRIRKAGTQTHLSVAETMQNLATALKDAGALHEADSLAARAHEIFLQTTATGHPLRAFPLLTRAEILLALGDHSRAEEVSGAALEILRGTLPTEHYAIGVARCRLGASLLHQGRVADATSQLRTGLEVLGSDTRTPPAYLEECARAVEVLDTLEG